MTEFNYDYIFGDIEGYSSSGKYSGSEDALIQRVKSKYSTIVIPEYIIINGINYKVEQIGRWDRAGVFPNSYQKSLRNNITELYIPNTVISIGDSAFGGYVGLKNVTIPNSVISIGNFAFNGCTGLTSISIPSSVTSIGDHAFNGCTGITSISIPSSVTSIGDYAFNECTGLTSISIPSSVTSIGQYAFYYLAQNSTIYVQTNAVQSLLSGNYDKYNTTVVVDPSKF